jgi:hypothetical protein
MMGGVKVAGHLDDGLGHVDWGAKEKLYIGCFFQTALEF